MIFEISMPDYLERFSGVCIGLSRYPEDAHTFYIVRFHNLTPTGSSTSYYDLYCTHNYAHAHEIRQQYQLVLNATKRLIGRSEC